MEEAETVNSLKISNYKTIQKDKIMKTKALNIKDFEIEKINKEAQKSIRGGDGETTIDPNNPNPVKNGGSGNG